jgi:sugar porter (SP) family MFS transporter
MLGIAVIPGAALAIGMLTVPSTPRWLVQRGRRDDARTVLERLRSDDAEADVDAELKEIEQTADQESSSRWKELLGTRVRPLLLVGLGLAVAQQLIGVNTVIYYAPTILKQTGLSNSGSIAQTVFVGVTNVVFTVAAVLLLDRVGRRKLLLTGTAVTVVALCGLALFFLIPAIQHAVGIGALALLILYIAGFAIGLGPVFWLMISEIYPTGVKSKAMSVSTIANWLSNFIVAGTFLTLSSAITRPGIFFLYAGIGVLAFVFFLLRVPETKGRSLEDIQGELVGDRS